MPVSEAATGIATAAAGLAITPFATIQRPVTADEIEEWESDAEDMLDEELDLTDEELDAEEVRDNLALLVLEGRKRYIGLADRLIEGKVKPRVWGFALASDLVVRSTAASMLLLKTKRLKEPEREDLADELNEQLGYLANFRKGVSSGAVPLDGRVRSRSGSYGDSAWATAMAIELSKRIRAGAKYGRRELGSAKHCGPCVEYAGWGWTLIDEVVPIGDTPCGSHCHCWIEYR
jgi:hypothetical protein